MKISRYKKVYDGDKVNAALPISRSRKAAGVYLIKDDNGQIIYVGHSRSDIYRTMLRHFQTWNDRQQERVKFNRRCLVRIVITTPAQATRLEKALIKKYRPKHNADKYDQQELTAADKATFETYDDLRPLDFAPF